MFSSREPAAPHPHLEFGEGTEKRWPRCMTVLLHKHLPPSSAPDPVCTAPHGLRVERGQRFPRGGAVEGDATREGNRNSRPRSGLWQRTLLPQLAPFQAQPLPARRHPRPGLGPNHVFRGHRVCKSCKSKWDFFFFCIFLKGSFSQILSQSQVPRNLDLSPVLVLNRHTDQWMHREDN